jgi:hypothetical protein
MAFLLFTVFMRRSAAGTAGRYSNNAMKWRIGKWRTTADEDGHYCFAVAL